MIVYKQTNEKRKVNLSILDNEKYFDHVYMTRFRNSAFVPYVAAHATLV